MADEATKASTPATMSLAEWDRQMQAIDADPAGLSGALSQKGPAFTHRELKQRMHAQLEEMQIMTGIPESVLDELRKPPSVFDFTLSTKLACPFVVLPGKPETTIRLESVQKMLDGTQYALIEETVSGRGPQKAKLFPGARHPVQTRHISIDCLSVNADSQSATFRYIPETGQRKPERKALARSFTDWWNQQDRRVQDSPGMAARRAWEYLERLQAEPGEVKAPDEPKHQPDSLWLKFERGEVTTSDVRRLHEIASALLERTKSGVFQQTNHTTMNIQVTPVARPLWTRNQADLPERDDMPTYKTITIKRG